MRFGLGEYNKEYTLQEIADQEGVHRQRIRQIESVALRMLRHSSVSDNFRVFIDPN
jgi:DNA-directed RNA polymerase sigma subunit (sigma70/sigma32)